MIRKTIKLPLMLVIIFIICMFVLDIIMPGFKVEFQFRSILSPAIFSFGVLVILFGGHLFRKAKTTVNPMTPEKSTELVTSGIYSVSRNPMYIGFLALLVACTIFIGNVVNFLLLPLYIGLVNKLYIIPEEKALEQLFKNEFIAYKTRVRRWI